jgi:hypothetical protein
VQEGNNIIILANALLGWYLDKAKGQEIPQICDRHKVAMGSSEFFVAMGIAQCWLETGENSDQITPENAQKLVDKGIDFLVQELGAIPGKDISPDGDGGFVISHTLLCKISALGRSKENR